MFAPVADERDAADLTIEGELPDGLSGAYLRRPHLPGAELVPAELADDYEPLTDITAGPIARVPLPFRVPAGLHGNGFVSTWIRSRYSTGGGDPGR